MLCTIYYFSIVLDDSYDLSENETDGWYKWILGITILTLLAYQIRIEVWQIIGSSKMTYFSSVYNYFDLFQYSSTILIVLESLFTFGSAEKSRLRIIAAFSIFALWIKVGDWMRLFEPTAFYVKLV